MIKLEDFLGFAILFIILLLFALGSARAQEFTESQIDSVLSLKYQNSEQKDSVMVNLNTATLEELESINGVGPVLAQRILEYRNKTGEFKTRLSLLHVKGIGKELFFKIMKQTTL